MSRKSICSRLYAVALLFALLLGIVPRAEAAPGDVEPMNLLLIVADDLTYHDVGAFGSNQVKTPNLDALAAEGMRLTRMFTPAPMCSPTRMALFTGLYPVRNGGHPNHSRVHDDVKSMPHYLGTLGYRVGLLGKRHIAPAANFPFENLGGRDHDGGKGTALPMDALETFLKSDGKFCVVVTSNSPHTPWTRGDASKYPPDQIEVPPYLVDTPETREALSKYYAEVTQLDLQVGRLLQLLESTGHAGDTAILFLSEQGAQFPHAKWTLYDAGIRSDGIAKVPGVTKAGSTSDALLSYVDVLPTFIELAGGDTADASFDGRSFLPVLRGETDTHHDVVYAMQTSRGILMGPEHYGIRAARDDRFKYIRNLTPDARFQNVVTQRGALFRSWQQKAEAGDAFAAQRVNAYQHRPAEELYDLDADPHELHNLADDPAHAETLQRLSGRVDAWMEQQGDWGQATEMDALNRQPRHGDESDDV